MIATPVDAVIDTVLHPREKASAVAATARLGAMSAGRAPRSGYRFGDYTRGVVARGRAARALKANGDKKKKVADTGEWRKIGGRWVHQSEVGGLVTDGDGDGGNGSKGKAKGGYRFGDFTRGLLSGTTNHEAAMVIERRRDGNNNI